MHQASASRQCAAAPPLPPSAGADGRKLETTSAQVQARQETDGGVGGGSTQASMTNTSKARLHRCLPARNRCVVRRTPPCMPPTHPPLRGRRPPAGTLLLAPPVPAPPPGASPTESGGGRGRRDGCVGGWATCFACQARESACSCWPYSALHGWQAAAYCLPGGSNLLNSVGGLPRRPRKHAPQQRSMRIRPRCTCGLLRLTATTRRPAAASVLASSQPTPEPAPVTTATLPRCRSRP